MVSDDNLMKALTERPGQWAHAEIARLRDALSEAERERDQARTEKENMRVWSTQIIDNGLAIIKQQESDLAAVQELIVEARAHMRARGWLTRADAFLKRNKGSGAT